MGNLTFEDMYGKKSEQELIIGGSLLRNLIRRQEFLEIVYFSAFVGTMSLDEGIKDRSYLRQGFHVDITVAPVMPLFDLNKMNQFLDSLIEEELTYKKEFDFYGNKPDDIVTKHGELTISKPIGNYTHLATFPDEDIASILSCEDGQVIKFGEIKVEYKINVYPDVEVAKKAAPYFSERDIPVDLKNKRYKLEEIKCY